MPERRNILATFAQWRQLNRKDVEAVVQILPGGALRNRSEEIPISRGDHKHVDLVGTESPTRSNSCSWRTRSNFTCTIGRHVANLVQEDCSSVRELKTPDSAIGRAGESPLFVTK